MKRLYVTAIIIGALALIIGLFGCTALATEMVRQDGNLVPGQGVNDEMARTACGGVSEFLTLRNQYKEQFFAEDRTIQPVAGDDFCTMLAKVGVPSRGARLEDRSSTAYTYSWETGAVEYGTFRVHSVLVEDGRVSVVYW